MILVLRALGVGDLAAGVPAVRAVRSAFPSRTLALAAPAWLTPLIDLIGGVDRVVPTDGLGAPLPALPPVEVAVNLHGSGPESHRLLRAVRPAELWAFAGPEAGHLVGPIWAEEEHEVRRWCRLLRHYGVAADPTDLSLAVPDAAVPRGATIVHPGAKSPSRRWPPERYAAVAKHLAAAGHRVVITGSAAERDLAGRVAALAGLGPGAVARTGLAELAGLVAHARLLVSGDTGIAHLATAYGTPSVVLFGPVPPRRWGPPPDRPYHRAIWHGTRAERGDLPGPGVHPALLAAGVDEVLAATAEVERHAVTA
ncbi:glycosyl transferase [Actinoplanes sp. NBRC 14428]|uniref:ADP-heptose:LPS heptosyltransferase n=1 Tax=Pseudosporangium ferrugineum TaxID=439699 RepID=A0A2T0SFS2_9ACTN|nr:glycosyltransferase family 9 protein [Pseudosporangium ferrugineum]PRY32262.1 ADP-heptose:LPS heptosyltransferase [Pseudosporangium ferrugineum]BCJ49485.1 glycosyl transferase [Actinoplanes sp. NBRC 14428]